MPTHGTARERSSAAASSHWPNQPGTKLKQDTIDKPQGQRQPPGNLADVAFLDIADVCALARMSASWIHEEVRARRFPQPMRFGPRCTRWRSADVRAWLIARADAAKADTETTALVTARAKKASDAAQHKRRMALATPGDAA
jgi:predicted DNA-binding transcriptional regulator AlpA